MVGDGAGGGGGRGFFFQDPPPRLPGPPLPTGPERGSRGAGVQGHSKCLAQGTKHIRKQRILHSITSEEQSNATVRGTGSSTGATLRVLDLKSENEILGVGSTTETNHRLPCPRISGKLDCVNRPMGVW